MSNAASNGVPTVAVGGLDLARLTEPEVVDHVFDALESGSGGWLITANVDHLRRHLKDEDVRRLYAPAELVVADGMPLIWASRLAGMPLPERVAGSNLAWSLAERAQRDGRSLYLLGGSPGAAEGARDVLLERWPELRIAGLSSPMVASPPTEEQVEEIARELSAAAPDVVYVALGSPKQEELIAALRPHLPDAWMVGVGISLSFIAGDVHRAPIWMQRMGLEWLHRLWQEPLRLAHRYLVDDLGFALGLLWRSYRERGKQAA